MNATEQQIDDELNKPLWCVITHKGVERRDLTYPQAVMFVDALGPKMAHEATITTNAVAERMEKQNGK